MKAFTIFFCSLISINSLVANPLIRFDKNNTLNIEDINLDDNKLTISSPILQHPVVIPSESLNELVINPNLSDSTIFQDIGLINGDTICGSIVSKDADEIRIIPEFSNKEIVIPRSIITRITLSNKSNYVKNGTSSLSGYQAPKNHILPYHEGDYFGFSSKRQAFIHESLKDRTKIHISFDIYASHAYYYLALGLWNNGLNEDSKKGKPTSFEIAFSRQNCKLTAILPKHGNFSLLQKYWNSNDDEEKSKSLKLKKFSHALKKWEKELRTHDKIDLFFDVKTGAFYYYLNNIQQIGFESYKSMLKDEDADESSYYTERIKAIESSKDFGSFLKFGIDRSNSSGNLKYVITNYSIKEWNGLQPVQSLLSEAKPDNNTEDIGKEIVILSNGDQAKGTTKLLNNTEIEVSSDNYKITLPKEKILNIIFNNVPKETTPEVANAASQFLIQTIGGSHIQGNIQSIKNKEVGLLDQQNQLHLIPFSKIQTILRK